MRLYNSLRTDFLRAFRPRNLLIVLAIAATFLVTGIIGCLVNVYVNDLTFLGVLCSLIYIILISTIFLFPALYCSLFAGRDILDGTVKNRIVVGAKRHWIYLSLMTVCSAATAGYFTLLYFTDVISGYICNFFFPYYGLLNYSKLSPLNIIGELLVCLSTVSLMMLMTVAVKKKAAAVALCIAVLLGSFLASMEILDRLREPEIRRETYYYERADLEVREKHVNRILSISPDAEFSDIEHDGPYNTLVADYANPLWLNDSQRAVYESVQGLLPFGQSTQLNDALKDSPDQVPLQFVIFALRCLGSTAIYTSAGLVIFRRKNIF